MAKRFVRLIAGALLALAVALPSYGQESSVLGAGMAGAGVFMHQTSPEENAPAGEYVSATGTVSPGPLAAAAAREVSALVATPAARNTQGAEPQRVEGGNWISRHPVLFSTLVGAAVGGVVGATSENEWFCSGGDEDCVFNGAPAVAGAGIGAGIGAAVGALISLAF